MPALNGARAISTKAVAHTQRAIAAMAEAKRAGPYCPALRVMDGQQTNGEMGVGVKTTEALGDDVTEKSMIQRKRLLVDTNKCQYHFLEHGKSLLFAETLSNIFCHGNFKQALVY